MNAVTLILQATALMLALIFLRPLLKHLLSARARCALWAIPALRLLVPVEIASVFSLMASAEPLSQGFEAAVSQPAAEAVSWLGSGIGLQAAESTAGTAAAAQNVSAAAGTGAISLGTILFALWLLGAVVTGAVILYQNLRFFSAARRLAAPYRIGRGLPVYLMPGLPSPCLAGVFRPRIYINEQALLSDEVLEMTLRHERTHYRRRDHIWSAVRGLLLALYWFHPLVWLCSELFRADCETACDESATRSMSESERENYGMALISLAAAPSGAGRLICLSTMGGSKRLLKERITHLAKGRTFRSAALIAAMLAAVLCFTMCTVPENADASSPTPALSDATADQAAKTPEAPKAPANRTGPVPEPKYGEAGTVEDLAYFVELSVPEGGFSFMEYDRFRSIIEEYGDLLDDYRLIYRTSENGKCTYIAGEYVGEGPSPLFSMYSIDFNGEAQVLYTEEDTEKIERALVLSEVPSYVYTLRYSTIRYSQNSNLILIEPVDNKLSLDTCFSRYVHDPNGRAYIGDAVNRGIALSRPDGPYLEVYLISENYGEIFERIPLTAEEAAAILAEEPQELTGGFGFCAALEHDGETAYYTESTGVPRTVLDLAVEKCGYKFSDPSYIKGPVLGATLECSWLTEPLAADEDDLPRLEAMLKNAEFGYVGACGFGAKLTLELTGGETLTIFKGTDDCGSLVFGSYGGYFISDAENAEFWQIFGLDPSTKVPLD